MTRPDRQSLRGRLLNAGLRASGAHGLIARRLSGGEVMRDRPSAAQARRWRIEEARVSGRAVYTLHPREPSGLSSAYLHLHGGGFVTGLLRVQVGVLGRLADAAGVPVIVPDYPTVLETDAAGIKAFGRAALAEARGRHGAGLLVGGDSAGGTLALLLAQEAVRDGGALPPRLVLWSPWCDLSDADEAARDGVVEAEGLLAAGRCFAGADDPADPAYSPAAGVMAGLPPLRVLAGGRDPLYPGIARLAEAARAAGVRVDLTVEPGLGHYWMFLPQPEARRTIAATGRVIAAAVQAGGAARQPAYQHPR